MVATRVVLAVTILAFLLSVGASWLSVDNPQTFMPNQYNAIDIANMVGGYVGGQQASPPANMTQFDYNAFAWAVLPPMITGSWELDAAIVILIAALVLTFVSLARWSLSLPAGVLGITGSALWVSGVSSIASVAGSRLAAWDTFSGTTPKISVSASFGPYLTVFSGTLLLAVYFLARAGRLDAPFD